MLIQVNGEPREVDDGSSVTDLIDSLSLSPERIAVELNREVLRRREWPSFILQPNDKVEIIHFVGGG